MFHADTGSGGVGRARAGRDAREGVRLFSFGARPGALFPFAIESQGRPPSSRAPGARRSVDPRRRSRRAHLEPRLSRAPTSRARGCGWAHPRLRNRRKRRGTCSYPCVPWHEKAPRGFFHAAENRGEKRTCAVRHLMSVKFIARAREYSSSYGFKRRPRPSRERARSDGRPRPSTPHPTFVRVALLSGALVDRPFAKSLIVIHRARPGRRLVRARLAGAPGVRAGRVRVLRERLPELRAETLLVFLFASKACEEGVSRRALEEKKTTEGTGPYLYCRRTRP